MSKGRLDRTVRADVDRSIHISSWGQRFRRGTAARVAVTFQKRTQPLDPWQGHELAEGLREAPRCHHRTGRLWVSGSRAIRSRRNTPAPNCCPWRRRHCHRASKSSFSATCRLPGVPALKNSKFDSMSRSVFIAQPPQSRSDRQSVRTPGRSGKPPSPCDPP